MKTQSFWPLGGCPPALSRSIVATAPISPRPRPLPPQMRVTVLELRVPGAAPDARRVPPASFAHAYVCAGPPRRHARARYSPSACGRPGCRSLSVPPRRDPSRFPALPSGIRAAANVPADAIPRGARPWAWRAEGRRGVSSKATRPDSFPKRPRPHRRALLLVFLIRPVPDSYTPR